MKARRVQNSFAVLAVLGLLALVGCVANSNTPGEFDWYWAAKESGEIGNTVQRVTFSGPGYVIVAHKPVPLNEPVPSDVRQLAENYCGRSNQKAVLKQYDARMTKAAAFECKD